MNTSDSNKSQSSGFCKKLFTSALPVVTWGAAMLPVFFAGCGTASDIVQLTPNTYIITIEDHNGVFGFERAKLQSKAISQANDFAKKKGKVAIPISTKSHPVGILGDWATFEYQFRIVDENSPEATNTSLVQGPDVVVENRGKNQADIHVTDDRKSQPDFDLYTELSKLDELRKRGLLSDAEFEVQKQALLQKSSTR